jgi:hypothetical protein
VNRESFASVLFSTGTLPGDATRWSPLFERFAPDYEPENALSALRRSRSGTIRNAADEKSRPLSFRRLSLQPGSQREVEVFHKGLPNRFRQNDAAASAGALLRNGMHGRKADRTNRHVSSNSRPSSTAIIQNGRRSTSPLRLGSGLGRSSPPPSCRQSRRSSGAWWRSWRAGPGNRPT